MGETYRSAGVDIGAGDAAVAGIAEAVAATRRPGVIGGIGGFGGLFALADAGPWRDPVLVSSTDGVGTKAEIARATDRLDTIGIDLVAMCVDDLVCQGAEPLFLLDYVSVGRLDPERMARLVGGVAEGCRLAGCALIGGEMAEHAGVMEPDAFDLVGFAVGAVERDRVLTGERVTPGDRIIGLPSPNLRSNGYTLARRVLLDVAGLALDGPAWSGAGHSLADELLAPSVVYAPAIVGLLAEVDVRAVAHVTGGGLAGNLARVLPAGVEAVVDRGTWATPRIFDEIARLGPVDDDEMARVFNLGLGMVVVVPATQVERGLALLRGSGHAAVEVGEIAPAGPGAAGTGSVRLT